MTFSNSTTELTIKQLEHQLALLRQSQGATDSCVLQSDTSCVNALDVTLRAKIESNGKSLVGSAVFIFPEIPPKKMQGALASYGGAVKAEDVLVLVDDTVFGSAKEGMLITSEVILAKPLMGRSVAKPLEDIRSLSIAKGTLSVNGNVFAKFTTVSEDALAPAIKVLNEYLSERRENGMGIAAEVSAETQLDVVDVATSPSGSDKMLTAISNVIDRNKAPVIEFLKAQGTEISVRVLQDEANMRLIASRCYQLLPTAVRFVINESTFIEYALSHREPILNRLLFDGEKLEVLAR
jgi:hypothetical protein